DASVASILDGYLAEFHPVDADNPAKRDYARWYGSATANNITTEKNVIRDWIANRSGWMDSRFVQAPAIDRQPGPVAAGETTTFPVPSATTVYYTVDGSDPRAEGGVLAPGAYLYNGTPVSIPASM